MEVNIRGASSDGGTQRVESWSGALHATLQSDVADAEFRTAYCIAGTDVVVPRSDLSAVPTADNIIAWTAWSGLSKTLTLCCSVDKVAGNTFLGWWYTVNAGSAVIALDRLREALGSATGKEAAKYLPAGTTLSADENKGSGIVPPNTILSLAMDAAISDVYCVPVSSAATAVGTSLLTVIAS
jgi:hypothetical protein